MNRSYLNNIARSFQEFLSSVNHPLGREIAFDSGWQKYACPESRHCKTSARYRAHSDGVPCLKFMCMRCGISESYSYRDHVKFLSPYKRQEMLENQARLKNEGELLRNASLQEIKRIWNEAEPCVRHGYLARKGLVVVAGDGLRVDAYGRLLCPVMSFNGVLLSLQTISVDGLKRFYKNTSPKGGFHIFGSIEANDEIYFAEGVATSITIKIAVNKPVVCTYGKHFDHVVSIIAKTFPNKRMVYCCDSASLGEKVTSQDIAMKAVTLVDGRICLPDFSVIPKQLRSGIPRSDYNDLFVLLIASGLNEAAAFGEIRQQLINI